MLTYLTSEELRAILGALVYGTPLFPPLLLKLETMYSERSRIEAGEEGVGTS